MAASRLPLGLLILPLITLLAACAAPAPDPGRFEMRPVLEAGADLGIDCTAPTPTTSPETPVVACDRTNGEQFRLGPAAVDGAHVSSAEAVAAGPTWAVIVHLDDAGAESFRALTSELVGLPSTDGRNRLALLIDGVFFSAPAVQAEITDGSPMISGSFTEQEARAIAARLAAG